MSNPIPVLTKQLKASYKQSPYPKLIKYMLIAYLVSIVCSALLQFTIRLANIENLTKPDLDVFIAKYGPALVLAYAVVIAPVFEEFAYRGYLVYKPKLIALSAGLISAYVFAVLYTSFISSRDYIPAFLISTGLVFLLSIGFSYVYINKDELNDQKIKKFWESHPQGIFIFSIILFGLIHVPNYEGFTTGHLLLIPLIIGPQMICGYFLGKLRIEYGLIWSIQLHVLINGVHFLPLLLLKSLS